MRDIISHHYSGIDTKIGTLRGVLIKILSDLQQFNTDTLTPWQ